MPTTLSNPVRTRRATVAMAPDRPNDLAVVGWAMPTTEIDRIATQKKDNEPAAMLIGFSLLIPFSPTGAKTVFPPLFISFTVYPIKSQRRQRWLWYLCVRQLGWEGIDGTMTRLRLGGRKRGKGWDIQTEREASLPA